MKSILIAAVAAFLYSCGHHDDKTEAKKTAFDIAAVKSHITEMNKTYSKRFTTSDSSFFVDRYCTDAQVMSPNLETVKGREAIRKFFYGDGQFKDVIIELPDGNVYGNGDLVVEESTYNFPDGKGGSVDKGKFIALWKQEEGRWKLYREIWNTDLPPAPSK